MDAVRDVWVLILDWGYDGQSFQGVYSSEEKAWAAHGQFTADGFSTAIVERREIDADPRDVGEA